MIAPNKPLVIYHADCLDGFGAAFSAWCHFGNDADFLPAEHGDQPPDVAGRKLYILDYSYKRPVLLGLKERAAHVILIDHHKTAQADLAGLDFALFDMNRSACVMAWEYFNPLRPIPKMLLYIQDRDLWRFEMHGTNAFNEALRYLVPQSFNAWEKIKNDAEADRLAERGVDLRHVLDSDVQTLFRYRHEIMLLGIKGLACNVPAKYASELGNWLAKTSGTFGLCYFYAGDQDEWLCSLRSVGHFDVSEIARKFGGGGHRNAAGFSIKTLDELRQ
ncbi:MAG: DHHA1 domain-containing protein [Gammaproteobacteria bacterium]